MNTLPSMNGTIATADLSFEAKNVQKITLTSTPYISPNNIYINIVERSKELQKKKDLSIQDLDQLKQDLRLLPPTNESYEECLFLIQKLTNLYNKQFRQPMKRDENESTVETFLIKRQVADFINAGKYGRSWIAKRLPEENYNEYSKEELQQLVRGQVDVLTNNIEALAEAKTLDEVLHFFEELEFDFSSDILAQKVGERWMKQEHHSIQTLTQVCKRVNQLEEEVRSEGIVEENINEEMIHTFQNRHLVNKDDRNPDGEK